MMTTTIDGSQGNPAMQNGVPTLLAPHQSIAIPPIVHMQHQFNATFAEMGRVLRAQNERIETLEAQILQLRGIQSSAQEDQSERALLQQQERQITAENATLQQQQVASLIQSIADLQAFVQTEVVAKMSIEKANTEQQLSLQKESLRNEMSLNQQTVMQEVNLLQQRLGHTSSQSDRVAETLQQLRAEVATLSQQGNATLAHSQEARAYAVESFNHINHRLAALEARIGQERAFTNDQFGQVNGRHEALAAKVDQNHSYVTGCFEVVNHRHATLQNRIEQERTLTNTQIDQVNERHYALAAKVDQNHTYAVGCFDVVNHRHATLETSMNNALNTFKATFDIHHHSVLSDHKYPITKWTSSPNT